MKTFPAFIHRLVLILALVSTGALADLGDDIQRLQIRWAEVNYELTGKTQLTAFESLIEDAESVTRNYPDRAEGWVWGGIIKSTYAGARGGLGALKFAKASKADLETAMKLDPDALNGSAYTSLGTLYYNVPGWPVGFGDDDKAEELLKKALTINPDGIDSNYFYGDFLYGEKRYEEAREYLIRAQNAPPRPGRELADAGRQREIAARLADVESHR